MNSTNDLSRILTKGSAKQRALLLFNDMVEKSFVKEGDWKEGKGFLTEPEQKQLWNSFNTESEVRLYNRFLGLQQDISQNLLLLKQLQFKYQGTIARLSGYCLLQHEYTQFEETLNAIYYAIETPEQGRKVLDVMEMHNHYLFATIGPAEHPDRDGVEIRERTGLPLKKILDALSCRAMEELVRAKTIVKVIRDTIEENEFDIEVFKDMLDEEEKTLQEDRAPLPKFSRKKTEEGILKHADNAEQRQRMEDIFRKNWVFPEYEEAAISETLYKVMRQGGQM